MLALLSPQPISKFTVHKTLSIRKLIINKTLYKLKLRYLGVNTNEFFMYYIVSIMNAFINIYLIQINFA